MAAIVTGFTGNNNGSYWYDPRHRSVHPGQVVILGDKKQSDTSNTCKSHSGDGGNFCFSDAHVEWRSKPQSGSIPGDAATDTDVWDVGEDDYEHDTCLIE